MKKGDEPNLSFHKEHGDKLMVLPCPLDMPICADDKGNNGELFCFVYTTLFKKVKLSDENQIKETFINEGRGHPPSHLKFFLLVFSKLKEDIK